jgi:hypothetical protein
MPAIVLTQQLCSVQNTHILKFQSLRGVVSLPYTKTHQLCDFFMTFHLFIINFSTCPNDSI